MEKSLMGSEMNNWRGYFVLPAIAICCLVVFSASSRLGQQWSAGWLGALLAGSSFLLVMGYLMLARVARTSRYLPVPFAIAVLGLGLALFDAVSSGAIEALGWSVVGAGIFFLYIFWYSSLGQRQNQLLMVTEALPDFDLETLDGATFPSARFRTQASLLLFFRGNWCPLCMAQIKELSGHYQELEKLGVQIALISPQPQRHSIALARRDAGGAAARLLGIFHPRGLPAGMEPLGYEADTVMPTLVITDANGQVIFLDQTDNYRLRPEPEVFIDIAKKHLSD
jgi:peroxiredoxin